MKVFEHAFEQAGVALQPGSVDHILALLRRPGEQVERRHLIMIAKRQACLADAGTALAPGVLAARGCDDGASHIGHRYRRARSRWGGEAVLLLVA